MTSTIPTNTGAPLESKVAETARPALIFSLLRGAYADFSAQSDSRLMLITGGVSVAEKLQQLNDATHTRLQQCAIYFGSARRKFASVVKTAGGVCGFESSFSIDSRSAETACGPAPMSALNAQLLIAFAKL